MTGKSAALYLIVAGSRTWRNYALMARKLDHLTQNFSKVVVVSGCARGADTLGERWANDRGHEVKQFPADWNRYGKQAGFIRNVDMADFVQGHEYCGCALFWDGESRGTQHMRGTCEIKGIPFRVIGDADDFSVRQ